MHYSKKNNMWYQDDFSDELPDDIVTVTDEDYATIVISGNNPFERFDIEQLRAGMALKNADARLKLINLGLFDRVDALIMSMPRNSTLFVLWEYGETFHRNDSSLIDFCKSTLGMTDEQIDELFTS